MTAAEWPTCPSELHYSNDEPERCVLPQHHEMDGESWHTNGGDLRWNHEEIVLTLLTVDVEQ